MRTIRECDVAVVGGAGFLGSHLVDHLIEDRGCRVTVVDNLVVGRLEFIHKEADFVHHNITGSEDFLRQLFALKHIHHVFNYAAYPYIPDSFVRPIHVADVNFMGAMKVINAAQEAGCEGILQVSSAEIYGLGSMTADEVYGYGYCPDPKDLVGGDNKITEEGMITPHSSYGVAKAAVDNWVQVRWREAKTPCIALRQFNCVGERETHPYIVPEIVGQLAKQQFGKNAWEHKVNVGLNEGGEKDSNVATVRLGNDSFRDFMYAGDAVRIAVELLERGQWGEVYNLGSETGIKMYDLAKLIGKLMGFADVKVERDESRVRPWEIWHLCADISKIKNVGLPSLSGLTTLDEALRRTIKWYEGNGRKWPWEK